MRTKPLFSIFVITLLAALLLGACRREEEQPPTVVPTAVVPTETAGEPATGEPATPTAGIPAADINWPPQVIYSSPTAGEEVLLDGAITVRFDQPMDRGSVESAFLVQGEDGQVVNGQFTWPRPDTVVFTPAAKLARQSKYQVNISDTATGVNGQPLRQPVDLKLQTVGYLEVSQILPANGTQEVDADAAITVIFNRPVVPVVAASQQAGLPQPLQIQPAVAGTGTWVSSSIYRFTPDEPLAGATTYQISIPSGLTDITGGVLADNVTSEFTTLSPTVVSIEPFDGTQNMVPTDPFTVTFNMPMDRASVEAATRLTPSAAVTFDWSDDSRMVLVRPQNRLNLGVNYQLAIEPSARSANGEATIGATFSSSVTTVPLPRVTNVTPRNGATADRYQRGVQIQFASPMDMTTLEDKLQIQPEPENVTYYFNQYDYYLYVDFPLQRNTSYQVTIPGTAADPYGNTLGQDYVWRFNTPPFDPLVSLNLTQWVSQISTSYPSDVQVIYRNISRIDATLTNLGLPTNMLAEPYTVNDYSTNAQPIASWSEPVSAPVDQADVYNLSLAGGQALPTGVYLLTVNAPEANTDQRYWQNQRVLLIVADTNLVVKQTFEGVYVWATNLATGEPTAGLNLTLYDLMGVARGTAVTDENGLASFPYTPDEPYLQQVLVVSSEPGQAGFGAANSNWNEGVTPWSFGIPVDWGPEQRPFAYVYTDRPIYRPGDTVHFRGIVRDPDYGRYTLPQVENLTVAIGFLYNYGESDFTQEVTLDADGTFAGEYIIPETADLGVYRIFFQTPNVTAERNFTVSEYRKPEFLVTVTPPKTQALRGEALDVVVQAEYLFGAPATDLAVNWTIYDQAYTPPWEVPYYSFSDDNPFFFAEGFVLGDSFNFYGSPVLNGTGRTNERGELVVRVPASLLQNAPDGSRQITVEASITDVSNFPVTGRAGITLHAAETYVGIKPADYIVGAGQEASVDLITIDWNSQPVANAPVEIVFYQREWESRRVEQYGQYMTTWEPVDTEVGRDSVTSDSNGEATASFTPTLGGTYVAKATVTDDGGRSHTSITYLWVTDPNYAGWRSDPTERSMDLVLDKQSYQVGDTARVLVQSPFSGPARAWLTVERGDVIEQSVVTLNSSSDVLEIPITDIYAPNVFVSVTAVKGIDETNQYADIRLGITELVVSPERLTLNVQLTPRETQFAPGDTAVYDILVTDYQGNGVVANLSLSLVDLAVLSLAADNAPNIVDAFYARQPYRSQVGAGLFVSGEGLAIEIPQEALGLGGGGGGDLATADSVRLQGEEEDDVRQEFPDTAYWNASITTDANGQATVEILLPDSLTTWRLSSKAVTSDSLVGQSSVDVRVSKPVLLRPVTPRFMTVGDELTLGATVHNNTGAQINVRVSLTADGVTLNGAAEQQVAVDAGRSQLVQWPVTVEDVRFVDLTFRAEGGGYSDAVKPTFGVQPGQLIPVYRYDAEDVVGTSGVLDQSGRVVEGVLLPPYVDPLRGEVQIKVSPSLAAALLESLDVIENSYDETLLCAHSVMDHLLPNVATARALSELGLMDEGLSARLDEWVSKGLAQIESLQRADGAWGWCFSPEPDPYLTAYVLLGLTKAQDAGYGVNSAVLEDGINYLTRQLRPAARLAEAGDVNRQAFFLYVLAENGENVTTDLDELFNNRRDLLDPYAQALLALAYELSNSGGDNQQALLSDLNNNVILSATGAHWEDAEPDWYNLNSDIRGTAMILDALARIDPANSLAERAVRWLMTARQASQWSTGQQNAWVILALTDWMAVTGELDADYGYYVAMNTNVLDQGQFTADNITTVQEYAVPVSDLALEDVNFLFLQKEGDAGRLYYTAHLDSFIDANQVEAINRGVTVQRTYYDAACQPTETQPCPPLTEIAAGQQVRVELTVIAPHDLVYAIIEDHFPAGAEAIDPGLLTSASDAGPTITRTDDQGYRPGYWGWWYFDRIEYRDERVVFLSDFLPAGTYQYSYTLQTAIPGVYQVMPATAREEFFPEVFGRSSGLVFEITE